MKPDKKYMSESSYASSEIHFTPPSFSSILRQNSISDKQNSQGNSYLDLYPSETEGDFLYCYYSSFGDCEFNNSINKGQFSNYNNNNNSNQSQNYNNNNSSQFPNYNSSNNNNGQFQRYTPSDPTPSEILRDMDLDIEDLCDPDRKKCDKDVDRIYSMIERNNRGLFTTFSSYRIPYPIAKILIKRIVKLTLSYCEKEGD